MTQPSSSGVQLHVEVLVKVEHKHGAEASRFGLTGAVRLLIIFFYTIKERSVGNREAKHRDSVISRILNYPVYLPLQAQTLGGSKEGSAKARFRVPVELLLRSHGNGCEV